MTPEYLVSACLAGKRCRYDGESRPCPSIIALVKDGLALPVCPESLSGLPMPRPPAELQPDGKVLDKTGNDVSKAFARGSARAFKFAVASGCRKAILKARSPSCGVHEIYDGSFTGKCRAGMGVFAQKLVRAGIEVIDEEDYQRGKR